MRAAIGADLGGTKMAVGVVDAEQNVLHRGTEPTTGLHARGRCSTTLERELREALDACPEAEAIGVGIPCTIDRERGFAITAVNLPIANVPIRDMVAERLGLPVFVDNDANLAALAEHRFGAARGARNMVMLTIGTGIGGGLVLDGELYRGTTGRRGRARPRGDRPERAAVPGQLPEPWLRRGVRLGHGARRAPGGSPPRRHPDSALGRALAAGEEIDGQAGHRGGARPATGSRPRWWRRIGRHLGVALASFANIFEPDVIVIGGGAAAAGELLLGPARDELRAARWRR